MIETSSLPAFLSSGEKATQFGPLPVHTRDNLLGFDLIDIQRFVQRLVTHNAFLSGLRANPWVSVLMGS